MGADCDEGRDDLLVSIVSRTLVFAAGSLSTCWMLTCFPRSWMEPTGRWVSLGDWLGLHLSWAQPIPGYISGSSLPSNSLKHGPYSTCQMGLLTVPALLLLWIRYSHTHICLFIHSFSHWGLTTCSCEKHCIDCGFQGTSQLGPFNLCSLILSLTCRHQLCPALTIPWVPSPPLFCLLCSFSFCPIPFLVLEAHYWQHFKAGWIVSSLCLP